MASLACAFRNLWQDVRPSSNTIIIREQGLMFSRFISEDCEGNGTCNRMKTAVWFDLIGMLLWAITAVIGGVLFRRARQLGIGSGSAV